MLLMKRSQEKTRARRGFTLSELLIVVAIIAVLTAIAIPIFTKELEKSREATDLSNIRAAYAEVMADVITGSAANGEYLAVAQLRQTQDDWQMDKNELEIGGIPFTDSGCWVGKPTKGGFCMVTFDPEWGPTFTFSSSADSGESGNAEITPETRLTDALMAGATKVSTIYNGVTPKQYSVYNQPTVKQAVPGVIYENMSNGLYYQTDGRNWYEWTASTASWFKIP